jgi:hypothetical protein
MTSEIINLCCLVCDSQSLRTASPAAAKPPPPLLSAHKSSHRLSLAFAQQMLDIAETPVSPTGSVLLDPEFYFFLNWIRHVKFIPDPDPVPNTVEPENLVNLNFENL